MDCIARSVLGWGTAFFQRGAPGARGRLQSRSGMRLLWVEEFCGDAASPWEQSVTNIHIRSGFPAGAGKPGHGRGVNG